MELLVVDKEEYFRIISYSYNRFNSMYFNDLNKENAEKIYYFLFKDTKYRLGLIVGLRDRVLLSPFSAPFGGFSFKKSDISLKSLGTALQLLEDWASLHKIYKLQFTLPPLFYHDTFIAKEINSLFTRNYKVDKIDLNYHFETSYFNEHYEQHIWYSAKKSLKQSINNNLIFKKCIDNNEKELAYSIIKINREKKGFPLKMKYIDIIKTDDIIKKDFFLVYIGDIPIASAIIYYITDDIVQVVYWGDELNYSQQRPMNFISYMIFKYYKCLNIKYIDIGPSTENSIPNYGLCEFKESIGCKIVPKYTFLKEIIRE